MPSTVKVGGAGITLDILLWRRFHRRGVTSAMLSAALDMNPGISALGPFLPLGLVVTLPDLPAAPAGPAKRPAVSLFD
jgi:phage tail protein X